MLRPFKLINNTMTLDKLKSDLWMTANTEFGKMALNMANSQGNYIKQLSKHTATTIHHTCNGIISLCWHLLATRHKYVLLGQFTTDPLEKEFSKFCQGSEGTYFINIQQCTNKLHIKQTSVLLNQNVNIDAFDVKPGQQFISCDDKLCEEGSEIFDNLENLGPSLSDQIKMAPAYQFNWPWKTKSSFWPHLPMVNFFVSFFSI